MSLTVGGDPGSTAIGTVSDPESAAGNGTVIALLKRHRTLLAAILVLLGGGLPVLLLSGSLDTVTAKATAAAPVYVEGSAVKLSTDLAGALRTAGAGSSNPSAGRLDSIRYLQKLDTLNLIRAGRLDSLRRVQKVDTLSNVLAGRLDSLRRVQKVDTVSNVLAGRLDSVRRIQKIDTVSVPAIGVPGWPTVGGTTIAPAANTAGTITLAGVAGQFHYITAISFTRAATAALAGTALLTVTVTNIPGAPTWRFGNAMAAGGQSNDVTMTFPSPIKSSVANTNTTFIFPAPGAAVSWNCTVWHYTAP